MSKNTFDLEGPEHGFPRNVSEKLYGAMSVDELWKLYKMSVIHASVKALPNDKSFATQEQLIDFEKAGILAIARALSPGWVKCEDRLPEEGRPVPVLMRGDPDFHPRIDFRYKWGWYMFRTGQTYWFELPNPPDEWVG